MLFQICLRNSVEEDTVCNSIPNIESSQSVDDIYSFLQRGKDNTVKLYRAMEEKWFATSIEGATKWGNLFYSDGNYRIVEITINQNSLSDMFYCEKLDDIGPAFCASLEILAKAIKSFLGVK